MARKAASPKTRRPSKAAKRSDAAEPSPYTIFISHSSKERWIAQQIAKEIEALGAKAWLDLKDLGGGDEIRRAIKRGIRASHEAVVLLSENSITSQWVSYEVGAADILGKRVTLILNNIASGALAPMQGVKDIDLNAFDDFLLELSERIARKRPVGQRGVS